MKWAVLALAACASEPAPAPISAAGRYMFTFSNCAGDDASDPITGSMQLLASSPQTYPGSESSLATSECSADMAELRATLDGSDIQLDFLYGDGSVGRRVVGTFTDGAIAGDGTIVWNVAPYDRFLFSATRTSAPDVTHAK